MASYDLKWKSSAQRELNKLPQPIIADLVQLTEGLKENPYPPGVKKMQGTKSTWRIRRGDYRVIYTVINNILTIEIVRVGHRQSVYDA